MKTTMKIGSRIVVACLVLILCSGCAASDSAQSSPAASNRSNASSTSQDATSSNSSLNKTDEHDSDTATAGNQNVTTDSDVDLEELSQALPTKGLPEKYIDQSWLGAHDKVQKQNGITTYSWLARNGTDDTIFSAYCKNGFVTRVAKHYFSSGYWPSLRGLPDLYTTTPFDNQENEQGSKYSPRDYDSAEEWEADTDGSLNEWDRQ